MKRVQSKNKLHIDKKRERVSFAAHRLYSDDEINRYVDVDMYEENFYAKDLEVADYYLRKRTPEDEGSDQKTLLNPAFIDTSAYTDSRETPKAIEVVSEDDAEYLKDVFIQLEAAPDGTLRVKQPEEEPSQADRRRIRKESSNSDKHANRMSSPSAANRAHTQSRQNRKQPQKPVKQETQNFKNKKSKKGLIISLLVTICLLLLLIPAFLLAYRYSNSEKYIIKRDKTPPTAEVENLTIFSFETVQPEQFVKHIQDETKVTVSFASDVDYTIEGEQPVKLVLTDQAGNKTEYDAVLTIVKDVTPPEMVLEPVIRTTVGQSLAYKTYVVVRDDHDPEPKLEIDNSQVDLSQEGEYPVFYTATDKSGNVTTKESKVVVSAASPDMVEDSVVWELIDRVLAQIITPEMDDLHKVWAVYHYINSLPYSMGDYSFNTMYEAYKLLSNQTGDCIGSYAAAKLMFDRLGITNMPIEMNHSLGRHFWNLVSLDGGQSWYHFDATPSNTWGNARPICMLGEVDLDNISNNNNWSHHYDKSAYPYIPAESLPIPDDVKEQYGYYY